MHLAKNIYKNKERNNKIIKVLEASKETLMNLPTLWDKFIVQDLWITVHFIVVIPKPNPVL